MLFKNITIYNYIPGRSLDAFKTNELSYNDGPVNVSSIMSQITAALRTLHLAGFIHRDIKPDNIYVTNEGNIYLLDLDQICDLSIPDNCKNFNPELISTPGFARYDNERRIRPYDFTTKDDLFAYGKILENHLRTVSKDKKDIIDVVGNRLTFNNKGGRYKKTRRNKIKRRNRKPTHKNRVR
jgi:serine/threonine protein kinase